MTDDVKVLLTARLGIQLSRSEKAAVLALRRKGESDSACARRLLLGAVAGQCQRTPMAPLSSGDIERLP